MPVGTETIIEVREVTCPALPPRVSPTCPSGRVDLTNAPDNFRALLADWLTLKRRLQCANIELEQWRGTYDDCRIE